jgi:hypothetical protein
MDLVKKSHVDVRTISSVSYEQTIVPANTD